MSSECYWCILNKPAYGNQLGTMGLPFACCSRCNVFICGHHGQRDNGCQKIFCFDCDKTILLASAISLANVQSETVDKIEHRVGIEFKSVLTEEKFKSLEDLKQRREGHLHFFDQVENGYIDYDNWSDDFLKEVFRNFPEDSQKLLVTAAILIVDTDTDEDLEKRGNMLYLNLKRNLRVPAYG